MVLLASGDIRGSITIFVNIIPPNLKFDVALITSAPLGKMRTKVTKEAARNARVVRVAVLYSVLARS